MCSHRISISRQLVQSVARWWKVPFTLETRHCHATTQKAGLDDSCVSSYRPISNLPHVSKILERIVNSQLIRHLEEHRLRPEVQSAYRRDHSTETAVLKVYADLIDSISNGKLALLCLLDLTAAFDTVDHPAAPSRYTIRLPWLDLVMAGILSRWPYIVGAAERSVYRSTVSGVQCFTRFSARTTALHLVHSRHWQDHTFMRS